MLVVVVDVQTDQVVVVVVEPSLLLPTDPVLPHHGTETVLPGDHSNLVVDLLLLLGRVILVPADLVQDVDAAVHLNTGCSLHTVHSHYSSDSPKTSLITLDF